MESCIYEGWVRHRRFTPKENCFRYSMYMMYLDLQELPQLFDPFLFWSAKRPAVAWFRRSEHPGASQLSLSDCVRNLVLERTGREVNGPIRLLTSLRSFGFQMNPVSYFYCFDNCGDVQAVVAEVNNTPWGEQHCYVVDRPFKPGTKIPQRVTSEKDFHVSPFMQMEMTYRWHLSHPAQSLNMHIENIPRDRESDERFFDVTMALKRTEISRLSMARVLSTYPFMTGKVAAGIYWQALRLWWKKVPFVPHPRKVAETSQTRKTIEDQDSALMKA